MHSIKLEAVDGDRNLEEREYLTCLSQLYPALECEDGGDQPPDPAEFLVLEAARQQELPTFATAGWFTPKEGMRNTLFKYSYMALCALAYMWRGQAS